MAEKDPDILTELRGYNGWNAELDQLARESSTNALRNDLEQATAGTFQRMVSSSQSSCTVPIEAGTPSFEYYPQPEATFFAKLKALLLQRREHERK